MLFLLSRPPRIRRARTRIHATFMPSGAAQIGFTRMHNACLMLTASDLELARVGVQGVVVEAHAARDRDANPETRDENEHYEQPWNNTGST